MEIIMFFNAKSLGAAIFVDNALKLMENPISEDALAQTGCALVGGLVTIAGFCLGV